MNNTQNSPKIYFVKKDNRFYNSRDNHFYESIVHANYERDLPKLKLAMKNHPILRECEIHVITENDLFYEYASQTTDVVLSGAYFANKLEHLDCKLPTISQVSKNMHKRSVGTINELKPLTVHYNEFLKKEEDRTDDIMANYEEYIRYFVNVKIHEMPEYLEIFDAFKKDKKSILGIARKVNKHTN